MADRQGLAGICIAVLLLSACGREDVAETAATGPSVGVTSEFEWVAEGKEAGETTVFRTGDGRVTVNSLIHWNNREYSVESELQLNAGGIPVFQRITGISPFQAPIDESFNYDNGVASWSTAGESGSIRTDDPGFYLATEYGALGLTALVRAALRNMDNEIALLPSGTARVEKLTTAQVASPDGPQTLSLYAISGLSFTPAYGWFDGDHVLTVLDFGGWMSMLPKGWSREVLAELSALQTEQDAAMIRRLSGKLSYPLDGPVVFDAVDVVDVENGRLREDHYVMVEDGRITAISGTQIDKPGARHIDARGKSLIPGMWDMHGHFDMSAGMLNIAGGITSVRDVGSVHEQIMDMTTRFDSGEVIGPHTYRSGFIDKMGPYAAGDAVESLEEALERVDFYADNGYMQIKLYSSIDPQWVDDIAERTHARGMRLSGHVPAFMSAEQAVRAGYDEIQHINMVFLNFLAGDREDTRKQIRFTLYGDEAGSLDLDGKAVEDFIALLRDKNVVVDPTAAIFDTQLRHHAGDPDPTFAPVIDHLPATVARGFYKAEMDMGDKDAEWAASAVKQAAMLKKLHDGGVQLVAGSDHIAAFTMHRELELYAEAGIPNIEVLRIASLDSARIVGVDARTGSITVGKDSDLVLVEGNPVEDMAAIRRATLVVKGNTAYRPDELYKAVGVRPFVASEAIR
jgi:imidazolonepropionase-like amidohydrolase